ncbi:MAG: hypothetical protein ACR2PO_08055 [Methyloligellaceae bacterium]
MQRSTCLLLAMTGLALLGGWAAPARAQADAERTDKSPVKPKPPTRLEVEGGVLAVHFSPGKFRLSNKQMLAWIARSARAVAVYYGRFPVRSTDILVIPVDGKGVKGGKAFGGQDAWLRVRVGRDSDLEDLRKDWVMVHEMTHLAFPKLDDRHGWLTEGLAVYVESIARLQAGDLDTAFVWRGFLAGMKHGLPQAGDRGLDHTPTWGRTYWGGAIFCLVADIEIRRQSGGRMGLQDGLRGVIAAGGSFKQHWQIRRALSVADQATGTTVLTDLYEAWRATAVDPKLDAIWSRLGVRPDGKGVRFDDRAPLAAVRLRIGQAPDDEGRKARSNAP